jgi:hypothetical protein
MEEEMIQMVDDDEIENVGIMSGFMDELEELMSELDAEEMGSEHDGEEADVAKMMSRTPDSPEILMNNIRGDMRSIDARREELADLVGLRQAEETPEGVLTLLQSVLAQEEAAPPMPMAPQAMPPQGMAPPMPPQAMAPPMPPQGMPPEMMGGMPPQGMPPQGMPPQGMPPQGIESIMPAMAYGGPVQNFNRGSGQMGVTPANDAFAAYPSDVVEEAQRRVRHMVDGGMVQNYNQGGTVQYYAKGTTPEAVMSAGRYSPEVVSGADAYIANVLAAQPSATGRDLKTMMGEEQELYETLGLGTAPEANQAQMLFDIGQAAFQYGSNTGPDGRPMQGSGAARLSQALGPLAGKVGARAGQMSKEAQALKMLALKGAQGKLATAQASDLALAERQGDIAMEIAKQVPASRMLTSADFAMPKYAGLDSTLPWQIDGKGKLSIAGGRETKGDTFNLGDGSSLTPGQKKMDEAFAPMHLEWMAGGGPDMGSQMASLAAVARELEAGNTNLTGLDVGLMPDIVNYFINPGAIDARDNVEAVVQRNLRLILGAQFTEREGVRLIARAYNIKLGEEENAGRVRRLLMQMTAAAAQKQAMSDYFTTNGTLVGWEGKMPSLADFEAAIEGLPGHTVADIVGDASRGADILGGTPD